MKTCRLSFCLLLALVSVGTFPSRLQAQGLPDNIPGESGNERYDYYYWSPRTGATVNSWNTTNSNWMLCLFDFNFTPGFKWSELTETHSVADTVYAVFWDETNPGPANTFKIVDLDSNLIAKGLHFRNQGWDIQDADHANTLTLISGNPTVPTGVDDRQAITMDTGSQATISANVILGAFPGSSANSDGTNQYVSMGVNSALTISGNISETGAAKTLNIGLGSGSLAAGTGSALTLSGANTFTGGVVLSTATTAYGVNTTPRLNLNSTQALGTGSLTIAGGAGILGNTSGAAVSIANAYVFTNAAGTSGNYVLGATQPVETESLVFAGANNLTLTADHALTANRAFGVENSGGALILAGRISGTGSLLKNLSGTLALTTTDNTYTGMTVINGGILEVAHLANGGLASSIGASNSTIPRSGSAFTVTNISTSGTATPPPVDNNTPIPALILGGGGTLRYTGAGDSTDRLIGMLAGQTNFTDAIRPVSIDASGAGPLKFTNTAAVVQINLPAQSRNLTLTGTNTGDNTFSLTFTDSRNAGNVRGNNQLTKNGPGTWIVTGNNTHTGGTTVNDGLLVLTGTNTTEAPATNTAMMGTNAPGPGSTTVNGGTLQLGDSGTVLSDIGAVIVNGGTFRLGASNETIGSLAGTGGTVDLFNGSGRTLTLAGNASGTFAGAIVGAGGSLVKGGTGSLTLSGTSTYTGAATINGGQLVVNGSLSSSSAVAINNGGTLGGRGTVGTVTINSGGTISPGNSPGTMNTGAQTWNGGGKYVWELNDADGTKGATSGTGWDWLNVTGGLTIASTIGAKFTIEITSLGLDNLPGSAVNLTGDKMWVLATAGGGITGFDPDKFFLDASHFANQPDAGHFGLGISGSDLVLSYSAIPEPSTYAIGIAALLGGLTLSRRRRANSRH